MHAQWGATVVGVCLLVALVATWPLAINLATMVPLGTERVVTVPLFSLWVLWWTADRAAHGFTNYWNASIFHPNIGVTTYSEPMPLIGLLVAPLWDIGASPALIYNLALLATLMLNGIFAYRLAHALKVSRLPALLGSVLMVTLPFVSKVQGVLPNVALFGMLWTLDGMVRFGRDGATRWTMWAVGGFVATYLTMQQYAYFFAPFAVTAGVVALGHQQFATRTMVRLTSAGLVAGLLVLLVALPAIRVHGEFGFQRPERVVQALSARPTDFLTRPETASFWVPSTEPGDTAGLFPGMLLLALALYGMVLGARDRARRIWTVYLSGSAVAASLLALGLNLSATLRKPPCRRSRHGRGAQPISLRRHRPILLGDISSARLRRTCVSIPV